MKSTTDIYSLPASRATGRAAAVSKPPTSSAAAVRPPFHPRRNYALGMVDRISADFSTASLTADQAVFASLSAARARARVLEANNSHVRKFLVQAKTSIIGSKGIRLRSLAADLRGGKLIPNRFDQTLIEDAYAEFSRASEFSADGRVDRRRFAQIGMQRVLVDGEFIVQKVRGAGNSARFALNMIDAERLDHRLNRKPGRTATGKPAGNEIRMGVEIEPSGRPVNYYFLKEAPLEYYGVATLPNEHEVVPADQILHIFIQERPGQTRGITWLAPTGLRTRMLEGITTAVTVGYRVAASKMGFFKRSEDYTPPENANGETIDNFSGSVPTDVAPGEFWELPEGLDFAAFDPGYPNAEYDGFKKSIEREIASGLGVSYTELANDFSGVSYSAGQIGVHGDISFWQDLQQFWIDAFEEPVYREWLLMAITAGALRLPITKITKFQRVKFQPPRRKHIDPKKTADAQNIALSGMTRDIFDICAENGTDFEDVVESMSRAAELLKEHNLPVPAVWGSATVLQPTPDPPED
jgi:lambda family phage portal protein